GDDATDAGRQPRRPTPPRTSAHYVLGGLLVAVSGIGLLHFAKGAPALDAGRDVIADAAGYVGALVGQPLHRTVATGGAVVVLVVLGVAGVLLLTGIAL